MLVPYSTALGALSSRKNLSFLSKTIRNSKSNIGKVLEESCWYNAHLAVSIVASCLFSYSCLALRKVASFIWDTGTNGI